MPRVVEDGLLGAEKPALVAEATAGVRIAVEARKVTARYVEADAMPPLEDIAGGADVDRDFSRLARPEQLRRGSAPAIARAQDAVVQRPRVAIGEDVGEPRGEVGV